MWFWPPHGLPGGADSLDKPPEGGTIQMWLSGVVFALVPTVYGVRCLAAGATTIIGRRGWLTVTGWPGIAFGITFVSLGLLMHFHYFWSVHPRLCHYCELGKLVSLLAFAGSLGVAVFGVLVFG